MKRNHGRVRGTRRVFTGGAAALSALLLLTGCVSTALPPDPTPAASLTAAPTPTPTEAIVAFDGKCGAVLSDDEVLGLISDVEIEPDYLTISSEATFPEDEAAGTLTCYWQMPVFGVSARVAPAAFAPSATTPGTPEPAACAASPRNPRTRFCTTTILTSEAFVLLRVMFPATERPDPSAAVLETAVAGIADRVDTPPRPAAPGPGWATSVSCDAIGDAIDVTSYLGPEALLLPPWDVLDAELQHAGYQSDCSWAGAGGEWSTEFVSATVNAGSGETIAASEYTAPVDIPGATVAYSSESDTFVSASDGVNLFTAEGSDAARIMASLLAYTEARG